MDLRPECRPGSVGIRHWRSSAGRHGCGQSGSRVLGRRRRSLPGAGPIIIVGLLVGPLAVMAMNQYGGSLTLLSIADSVRPIRATREARVTAILVLAAMVWGSASLVGEDWFNLFYGNAVIYLAYLFTPWTAINLVDDFVFRRRRYVVADLFKPSGGIDGRWGWRVGSTVIALLVERLAENPAHPAGFRIGHTVGGKFEDQRLGQLVCDAPVGLPNCYEH